MKKQQHKSLKFLFSFLLTILMFVSISSLSEKSTPFSSTEILAAPQKNQTAKVSFKDDSGKFLVKKNDLWYLYDSTRKPLTGIQYINIPATDSLCTGYYMFNSRGCLVQKRAIYNFKTQKVNNVVFSGYHYATSKGQFLPKAYGLYAFHGMKCGSETFSGVYYLGEYGRLTSSTRLRFTEAKKVGGISFGRGYYYFDKNGKLCTGKHFHQLNQKFGTYHWKGRYYFGGPNGRIYQKTGWVTLNNQKYYIDKKGKMLTSRWVSGYYLQANGTIARSKQLPDGTYVDENGRKCTKEEFVMGPLKSQIRQITSRYGGTWSVYVKNLKTGDMVNYNDRAHYPASTIKAFVMATVFDQIKNGKLAYDSSVKYYLRQMITVSDNESYNVLVRKLGNGNFIKGAAIVNRYLKKHGYTNTECHTTLHPAYSARCSDGGSNISSAKDCGMLMERIYKGTCVSKTASKEMLNLLLQQTRTWKIPYVLPRGVKTANKTGETSTVQHDMAIVYGPKTHYVISVFSSHGSEYYLTAGIQNISRTVYDYLN